MSPRSSAASTEPESPGDGRYWTSRDGLKLFYRDHPGPAEPPPLLCLHGLTRNSRDFAMFAARYAGRFRVIAVDFRGRGMSARDPQPERYVPATYAEDVVELLDHLGAERAVFVGTSLGGLVTMLVAASHLPRIAGVILNDIGPELGDAGLERIRTYVGKPVDFADWSAAAAYVAGINGNLPSSHGPAEWERFARRLFKQQDGRIVLDYDMAIAQPFNRPGGGQLFDMWPLYRTLARQPLLIIRGERSDLLSAQTAEAMVAEASDARLVTVPGVGHAPELSEPEAVAAIDDFLERFEA